MNRVLLVDDDPGMRAALEARFLRRGWRPETAVSAADGLEKFRCGLHPLIVTDVRMPGENGLFLMRQARKLAPQTGVILLTAFASVPEAVTAVKDGACDYLVKPVSFEQLEQTAQRILAQHHLPDSVGTDSAGKECGKQDCAELVGQSPPWLRALARARQAAASDADVLIEAESGTGKELVARLIHRLSSRCDRPFVAVNCAAFPESLLESELFGYAKGAFTGAVAVKPGKFELAHGGSLLLDEIGEMPLTLQPKLLRVLQEREFDRLGDTRPQRVNLRIIATTNCALGQMVHAGRFRADLYYRLNVISLALPPLRERREDIRPLAQYFVRRFMPADKELRLSEALLIRIENHSWPGNVRELANCMRRAVALATGPEISPDALEDSLCQPLCTAPADLRWLRPGVSLEDMERKLVEITLEATGGNRSRAAELLGVSLRTVRNKIRSYGLPSWNGYAHD
ncbi:MAG TPA: sigma-54 dependent transcriptional regulator [Verrucomicrobiae bacterium]|jgi:DNA-binding NtrC family response regulator|nr:sigma-54 dependent transcriptional regulator [Verrucomicrobiae bacterium]